MSSDYESIQQINNIFKEIDEIDHILLNKYKRNVKDIRLFQLLLENTNKYFYTIIKNLNNI